MVKPEHIGLLQSLTRGEDISENLPRNIFEEEVRENAQNPIDNIEEKDYNNNVTSKQLQKRLIAKRRYSKEQERVKEEKQKEIKRRAKQWKQKSNRRE